MKILAFESAAAAASVAVLDGEKLIASAYQNNGLTHSRTLLPMAEAMLHNCGLSPESMDAFAVSVGPGSFTGLRIGIALVKGMAYALEKQCCGVSTLEAMAYNLPQGNEIICAVMDARAGQVYNAFFDISSRSPRRLCDDRAISLDDLEGELKKNDQAYVLVGDGAAICYNRFYKQLNVRLAPGNLLYQNAYGVAQAANNAGSACFCSSSALTPCYLRLPQAERERQQKQRS